MSFSSIAQLLALVTALADDERTESPGINANEYTHTHNNNSAHASAPREADRVADTQKTAIQTKHRPTTRYTLSEQMQQKSVGK